MPSEFNIRRANRRLRDIVLKQVRAEEHTCHLCGKAVDKRLDMVMGKHGPRCKGGSCMGCSPHPMRGEVDEVIPVSRGGSPYDRANCRLAHRICNQKRGNKAIDAPKVQNLVPLVTSRKW